MWTIYQHFNRRLSAHLASSLPSWFCTITLHLVPLHSYSFVRTIRWRVMAAILGWLLAFFTWNHLFLYAKSSLVLFSPVIFLHGDSGISKPSRPQRLMWLCPFVPRHSQTFSLAICYSVTVAALLTAIYESGLAFSPVLWLMVELFTKDDTRKHRGL